MIRTRDFTRNPRPEAAQGHVALRLRDYHRAALVEHFLELGPEDRRLRFGATLTDEAIRAYVARIDFQRDGAFAIQDDELRLLAMVHVANSGDAAELGLSVLPAHRGYGLGQALLQRAVTHLRNRNAREVYVHCLSENVAMMHIARKSGMRIVYEGSESDARLELPPPNAATLFTEWLSDRQAEGVQALRRQSRLTRALLAGR